MTTTSKRSLIYESVVAIQIGVHPAGEKLDNTLYVRPLGPHVQLLSTKPLLGQNWAPTPEMKSLFLAIVQLSHHPSLPHSPSTKSPWIRELRFDKVVTKLLGLSGPIKARHAVSTILNLFTGAKTA
jgi:hypothetical protein